MADKLISVSTVLTDREREVIHHIYRLGYTQEETAEAVELSQPQVHRIEKAALRKLQSIKNLVIDV